MKTTEERYADRERRQEQSDAESIAVEHEDEEVTAVRSGLLVYLWVFLSSKRLSSTPGAPLVSDEWYLVSYLVSDESARRAESPKREKLDPRTGGVVLRC